MQKKKGRCSSRQQYSSGGGSLKHPRRRPLRQPDPATTAPIPSSKCVKPYPNPALVCALQPQHDLVREKPRPSGALEGEIEHYLRLNGKIFRWRTSNLPPFVWLFCTRDAESALINRNGAQIHIRQSVEPHEKSARQPLRARSSSRELRGELPREVRRCDGHHIQVYL